MITFCVITYIDQIWAWIIVFVHFEHSYCPLWMVNLTSLHKHYKREGVNCFWSIKNSTEILNKLKAKGFQASTFSTYDFSTLYTTLPHGLIRNQLVDLIEYSYRREEVLR